MKKLIILSAFVLATVALPFSVTIKAQEVQESPYAVITMGAVGVDNGFDTYSGGFLLGGEYPVAKNGDLAVRVTFSQLNWNPDAPLRLIQPIGVLGFNLGKGWMLDILSGAEFYVDGQNSGAALLSGLGGGKRFLTFAKDKLSPGSLDALMELIIVNAGSRNTGDYWLLRIGLRVNIPR